MSVYSSQIIKTLSEQIQNLLPLRQSFHHLQSYHSKLVHDLQDAISFGVQFIITQNISQADADAKMKYLEHVGRELEEEAYGCAEEAKKLECDYAKSVMEANQKAAHC